VSRERALALAHLSGYSTLALILGTASWSSFGWLFALPLVLGTLGIVGYAVARFVVRKARVAEEPLEMDPDRQPEAATDGGRDSRQVSPAEVAASVRRNGTENVRDDTIVRALEQGEANAGGGRNRRHDSETRN